MIQLHNLAKRVQSAEPKDTGDWRTRLLFVAVLLFVALTMLGVLKMQADRERANFWNHSEKPWKPRFGQDSEAKP